MASTVSMHYIEFVPNNIGVFDRRWFASHDEAKAAGDAMLPNGYRWVDEPCGEFGELIGPYQLSVALTPEGLLAFANEFAIDQGA